MGRKKSIFYYFGMIVLVCVLVGGTGYGLMWVNESMTVRYQAVGVLENVDGSLVKGAEVVLLLEPPPPAGPELDALFADEGRIHGRLGPEGQVKRPLGPTIGLSGAKGVYIVRATGRTGASRAIRLGLDSGGRPPFETAWLMVRRQGYPDITRTVSIMGWRSSPKGWGKFANRLPRVILD